MGRRLRATMGLVVGLVAAGALAAPAGAQAPLPASEALSAGWLSSGQIVLEGGTPFRDSIADGEIHVNANARMNVGGRVYGQRQLIRAQIMSQ